ncbi:MAG: secretin N-terminal domain-containing protein [Tepidisphaeraceae bacterium]
MRKWTKAAGLIFLAAASVYSDRVIGASPAKPAKPESRTNTDVKLLDEPADASGTDASPTSQPTTEPSSSVSPSMQTNPDGTFSLNITKDADLVETLRVIAFQAQKSVLPSKDVRGALPALDLYNVTVREALDAILRVNNYCYKEEGNFIYVYTAKEMAEIEKASRVVNTEVFRVYYTPAANAANMIKPVLSADAQVSLTTAAISGLDSGTKDVGGNSHATDDVIVVTDYPENLEKVRQILKEVDHRPQQILVEATILRASLTEDNALGVDFTVIGGVDFSTLTGVGTGPTDAITGAILNNPTSGSEGSSAQVVNDGYAGAQTGFAKTVPPGGLRVGIVQDNIAIFLTALEQVSDTVVLANPKVLALNKQKGEVIVGRKDGYLTTTTTDTSTVQTVDFLDTGTRLIFRPYIANDGYIRMEIHPEDSTGGLNASNLPFKVTTEVTSNIMVKDGRTIVIGGLFREDSNTARGQVPGLGNIPLAGWLFRNQRDRTTREEIIILLTPHIVKDDVAYSELSEKELKDAEMLRVGVRKEMMWFGRERLAETAYEQAVSEMNKPNPDRKKALWYLDCATNLNPKFMEAITLKQEITGKEMSTSDNSTIRSFVKRAIMADKAPATRPSSTLDVSLSEPATQPSETGESADLMQQLLELERSALPATQPSMARRDESDADSVIVQQDKMFFGPFGLGRPVVRGDENAKTTVTELPVEETSGQPQPTGGNK